MKRFFLLLALLLIGTLLFEGCEQENFTLSEEVADPSLPPSAQIPTATEDGAILDLDKLISSSAGTKSSWTYLRDFNFTRSITGWHQFANIRSSYFSNYEFRMVLRQTSRRAYFASVRITSSNNAYIVEGDHIYPNTNQERVLTQDDMQSSSDRGSYYVYNFTNSTNYDFDLYYRLKASTPTVPSGYSLIDNGAGVQLFKKNGQDVFVQRIDLSRAELKFVQTSISDCSSENLRCDDYNFVPKFNVQTSSSFWNQYRNQSKIFSITNAAFFDNSSSSGPFTNRNSISFPVKSNGELITCGHDNEAERRPYTRAFTIDNNRASMFSYEHGGNIGRSNISNFFKSYDDVMVGYMPSTASVLNLTPLAHRGRTILAIDQNDNRIAYLYSAKARTQPLAVGDLMTSFNCTESKILLLDSGGSASLHTTQGSSFTFNRAIPSFIAVYED
jgi:hypothetical protein